MNVRQSASEIEADAARWVMRLDRDGREAVRADLEAWLEGDIRRAGALLQAEAAWTRLDRAAGTVSRESRKARRGAWRMPSRRILLGGFAAAAATFIAGVAIIPQQPRSYVTTLGEIRRLPLADGSTASINSSSRMNVDFKTDLRRVALERGEAWFQVARDPSRPFRVEIGRVRVQAVGTAFSVRRLHDGVEVRVTEGVVKVWVEGTAGRTVELAAGTTSFVGEGRDSASPPVVAPTEIDRDLAWRSGQIDLAGETLQEAVAEFNRYNARALVIGDEALASERLYGVFRLDDPEGFARSVAVSLEATATSDAAEIRLSRPQTNR
ncbi:FecR family protein [Brevundimonas sp. TSRC1-1]|uniref:FecR family protein n=1 Tax=Brevundimonas sp. TSRC1-1 TaxID=2804562 RepID=UPI003CF3C710